MPQEWVLPGSRLRLGKPTEESLLGRFLEATYRELNSEGDFTHLRATLYQYLSPQTPFWFVELDSPTSAPVACLWVGSALEQSHGVQQTHILLLYVVPEHRRQGIGRALMNLAEDWTRERGNSHLSLQVMQQSLAAQSLYCQLGYQTQALWLVKSLK